MSIPLVEEVAHTITSAEFRNDVQVAHFRSERNLELVRDYIFTRKAASGRKSSIELLKLLCEAFMPGNHPNRFVVMATYGHGKSHFGLALANFFGKQLGTPEADAVMDRIEHALNDAALFGFLEAFKQNQTNRFMILILRGDEPSDLQTKFFRAIEETLRNDLDSDNIQVPFWYKGAERFVEGIPAVLRDSANEFLNQRHHMDLDVLLDRIRAQEAITFDIARDLHMHLYSSIPDFGANLSLKEALKWLGENLVGPDKPYSGLMILFDEFSSFVRDYGNYMLDRPGAPLQDLLNGVEEMRGRVAFVAFAQRDPEAIAQSYFKDDHLQSLITQLNRLPRPQRYHLQSSLEEVLDAYLKQDNEAWKLLMADAVFANSIGQASDLTYEAFAKRYTEELQWSPEHLQEIVTEGCFPLHPMTTAMFSSVELETTNDPRSVLGFVFQELNGLRGKLAHQDGKPTWVLPIALVDYFEEMLGRDRWRDYQDALVQAGGPDASPEHVAVLKAMLMQAVAKVSTRGMYDRIIAQVAGVPLNVASGALHQLASNGVIRFDQINRIYTFWPAGRGANKVEQILTEKVKGKTLDGAVLSTVWSILQDERLLLPHSVAVPWGHPDDWEAEQLLVSRQYFSAESIRELARRTIWRLDTPEPPRGLVLWLVAETPEDVHWFRDNTDGVLRSAFGDKPIPIIVMRPRSDSPGLVRLLLRVFGLNRFTNTNKADVGQQQYESVWQHALDGLTSGLKQLKDDAEPEVPLAFRARIKALKHSGMDMLLLEVYQMAYAQGPDRWFTQYKLSSNNLKKATALVANSLLSNALDMRGVLDADRVAREVVQQFLVRLEWGLVGGDLRIRPPRPDSKLYPGWQALENHFRPKVGSSSAQLILSELLNAPFGYDYNTLTLLFAAWFGYYRQDLEVSCRGRLMAISAIARDKSPKDFIHALCDVTIKRTDPNEVRGRVRDLLQRVERESFTQTEAREAIEVLEDYLSRDDVDQKQEAEEAKRKLQAGREAAETYDKTVDNLRRAAAEAKTVPAMAQLLDKLTKLPVPGRVRPDQPVPDVIRQEFLTRITTLTERQCRSFEHLKALTDYGLNERQLNLIRTNLDKAQLPDLVDRVDLALQRLAQAKNELDKRQAIDHEKAQVELISTRGSLAQLRENINYLNTLRLENEEAQLLAEEKLSDIGEKIEQLEALVAKLAQRLDGVADLSEVQALKEDSLRNSNLFDGTAEQEVLNQTIERCRALHDYFTEIKELRRGALQSSTDAEDRVNRLKALAEEYKSWLSPCQLAVLGAAIDGIRQEVDQLRYEALNWLTRCERALSKGCQADDLLHELSAPHPFLPDDQWGRVNQLRQQVQQHIDEDEISKIESHFRRITDPRKRLECVNRLKELVEELKLA